MLITDFIHIRLEMCSILSNIPLKNVCFLLMISFLNLIQIDLSEYQFKFNREFNYSHHKY